VIKSHPVPDPHEEIFLYQTLIGAWPLADSELPKFQERLEAYIIKAIREAMVHTRWTVPNTLHEQAVIQFVQAILKPNRDNFFLDEFLKFQRKIAGYGMVNGLAQILVKMTSPGVPDLYQGCELWDLRLVDPDNRGPVDFTLRADFLREIETRSRQDTGDRSKLARRPHQTLSHLEGLESSSPTSPSFPRRKSSPSKSHRQARSECDFLRPLQGELLDADCRASVVGPS
jgi:maltooligosyltrehalose synthase